MTLTIGGTDVASVGWWLVRSSGLDDIPTLGLSVATLPGREESVVTSPVRTIEPGEAVITLACTAASLNDLETKRIALGNLLTTGELTLTHARRPGRQRRAWLVSAPVSYGIGPEARAPVYEEVGVRVRLLAPWEDATAQSVDFTTSATTLPMGTLPSLPVITITASGGTVTDPVVTIKDGGGSTVATLSPDIAIASGDAWQVNVRTNQVRKRVSGTWSNAIDTLGDTRLPRLLTSWVVGGVSPTIEVTSGNGNASYRRRWR